MSTARWTIVVGVVIFAALIGLAAIGFRTLVAPLITVGILLALIAAGNLLYGNSSPAARRAQAAKAAQEARDQATAVKDRPEAGGQAS
jgi:hypothetical protein